ncbi:hypothetical protein KY285_020510 [Solanum tuberosum]|nr:hypothetical protein KY285_020510 [Solanum tuberosum]
MEPFQGLQEIDKYKRMLGLHNVVTNCSDKIWVFWDDNWTREITSDNVQQLTVKLTKGNVECLITSVYARCDALERLELWEGLEEILANLIMPWLVGGDFNVIRNAEEKEGGLEFSPNEAFDFEHCINRIERECIFKRLDRIFGNHEFFNMIPSCEVLHLIRQGLDHAPLQVNYKTEEEPAVRPFKFFNFWIKHPNFRIVVEDNWKIEFVGCPFIEFHTKIKKIATLEDLIRVKEIQLEVNSSPENREALKRAEAELRKFLHVKEEFWKQKAGMRWFQDGDRNTKFFHNYVKGRRKKLHLEEIRTELGEVVYMSENIRKEAISFFEELFREEEIVENEEMLGVIPRLITDEQNEEMNKIPSIEKVKHVLFALNGDSTSGPDGFSRMFYQSYWEIVGEDVTRMIRDFFYGKQLPRFVTHTNLVLLPKKENVEKFPDLRPVSLCTFINKIISRVIHGRISKWLPRIISQNQTGFIKGRSISENVILA